MVLQTYTSIEHLGVLIISKSLNPGCVVLADEKVWSRLLEVIRLRVQAALHGHCVVESRFFEREAASYCLRTCLDLLRGAVVS